MNSTNDTTTSHAVSPVSERSIHDNYRRNVTVLVMFELTWGLGIPFTLYSTMVPAYLTVLGASKFLIGAMLALWTICTPIQILSAHFLSGRNRARTAMMIYITAVGIRLLHDLAIILPGGLIGTPVLQGLFAVANIAFVLLIICAQPLFFGLMTDNIPREKRGRLYGLRTFGLGVGGLAMGVVASMVLERFESPRNYQMSFLVGDVLLLLSCFSLSFFRDCADTHGSKRTPFGVLMGTLSASLKGKLKCLLEEPNYRIFLLFHLLNVVAINLAAFIVPYAKERLGFLDTQVGHLSLVFLAAGAVFGVFIGRLADRYGYRVVAMSQSVVLIVFFVIAVNVRLHAFIYIGYGLYSLVSMSLLMVLVNMSVELCPSLTSADLTALGTTIILPVVVVVGPVMGALIDRTGDYFTVFLVGLSLAVVAFLGFLLIVQEPRRGRLYMIKQIMVR